MKTILANASGIALNVEETDWQAVYAQLLPKVFHFFCYKVGDQSLAEDLTAVTFEKAWRNRAQYRKGAGQVQAWLMGIARYVASDHFRKKVREVPLKEEFGQQSTNALDDSLQSRIDFQVVLSILNQFPEREKELIALKYGAELSNREIAKLTGISETNVGTILHRMVTKIRIEWEKDHEGRLPN